MARRLFVPGRRAVPLTLTLALAALGWAAVLVVASALDRTVTVPGLVAVLAAVGLPAVTPFVVWDRPENRPGTPSPPEPTDRAGEEDRALRGSTS